MKYVKFAMIAVSLLCIGLCLAYNVLSAGGQGVFVLICCALPAALGLFGTFVQKGIPRWAAIVSAVSLLLVGFKTSGGPDGGDLENLMLVSFLGMILAVVLSIKPDKAA